MIAPLMYQPSVNINIAPLPVQLSIGLSRMFAAAVVNRDFCESLLHNRQEALRKGYLGETFALTEDEYDLLLSIQAHSLADLARQINQLLVVE